MPLVEIKKSDKQTVPVIQPVIQEEEEKIQPSPSFVEAKPAPQLNQELIEKTFSQPFREDEIVKDIPQLSITEFKRNPEVVERAIRAMGYVDKTTYDDGTKAADRFVDYARDADFNITHGAIRLAKILSQKDKQTKEDIEFRDDVSWLYNEFYSIRDDGKYKYDAQGFAENLGLAGDIFAGAVTDLTNWGAVVAFPFTGGQSTTVRAAGGEAARQGLKAAIRRTAGKAYDKIPKVKIDPRKYSQTVPLLMGEGFVFGSTDYYLRQQLFNELDVVGYDEFSPTEMLKSGAFGATIGAIPGLAIPAGYRYFDAKALRQKKEQDSENFRNIILDKTPEREDVKIVRTDEPEAVPQPDAKVVTLEEASAESAKLRERNNNPEPSHVERVDSKEADAFPTEIIRAASRDISEEAPEVIVVDGETRLKSNPNEKPVIGGMLSRKSYDEAISTFLLFGKPTSYSRRLAEIDPNFDTFLRLIRHDSMDTMLDNPIVVLNSTAKQQRSYQEQVKDVVGQYMGRMITTVERLENFARQHPRYSQRGNFKVKEGTTLNEDLYTYLVRGDVRGGVPLDVINAGKDLRKIFDDVEKSAISEGFIFHSVENFFPRYYKPAKLLNISRAGFKTDLGKLGKRKEEFAKQLANDENMSFEEALTAVDSLTSKLYDDLDPTIGSLGQRKYKNLNTIPIKDLFVTDIQAAMSMYLNSMGRKIVRKKTLGFNQDEFEQKWLVPFFGGKIKPTDEVTARDLILDRLKARGFTESLIDTSTVGEYTRLNFLIRQNINNENISLANILDLTNKNIKNLKDVKNPKLLLTHVKQLNKILDETNAQALRPIDREIITNAQGNNLSEVIDKLIRARFDAGDFILRSQNLKGTLGVDSVIYKGTIKDPRKTMSKEKERVQILRDYIVGLGGVPQGSLSQGVNAVANSLLLLQSGNKLGMATLASLPETLIPFLKSNPSVALKAFYKTINEESRMLFKNITTDEKGRTLSRQELNQLNMVLKGSLAEAVQNAYAEGLGATTSKLSYAFYRSILLDQYAKFMQIFSYNAAKIMITDNLTDLSKLSAKELASDKGSVQRLKLPLVNLGIDIDQGVKFIKDGRPTDDIFNEVIRASAGRYADEVVMNPGRETAQKPLFMSHYFGKVIFQLFSYPVSVFNTVFRNAIRDISLSKGVYAPRQIAVITTMLGMTRLIRGIRTGGESLEEEYDAEAILKDLDYMGTGGPLTLVHTAIENNKYGDNEFTALLGILGPTFGGVVIDAIKTNRPESAFAKNILPYRNVIARVRPDLIHEFDQFVKDIGDTLRGKNYTEIQIRRLEDSFKFTEKEAGITAIEREIEELERETNYAGGKISSKFPVTDVKDTAAERINPITGEPYLEDEDSRVLMNKGGKSLLSKMQKYLSKEQHNKRLVEKYEKEGTDYIMTKDGPEIVYAGTTLAKSLGVKGTPEPGIIPVIPALELAGLISGKKLAAEATETVFQSIAKSRVPKKVYHGTTRRDLTALIPPSKRGVNQRFGIFANPNKKGVIKFTGDKGVVYEIDSSDISSLSNIIKFNKNKVLDADKPSSKLLGLIDKDIVRLKKSNKSGIGKQEDLFQAKNLESFKRDLTSPDNYISGYGKGVDSFLKRNNYGIIKTTPTFPKGNTTPNYIFTANKTPINDKFLTKSEFKKNPITGVMEKVYLIESKT